MAFDFDAWKGAIVERLRSWRAPVNEAGAASVYGALCGSVLWPLVEASRAGDFLPVVLALGGVGAGVGGNLIAEQVQRWMDRAGETDAAEWAGATAERDPGVRAALDAMLEKLEAVSQAQSALAHAPSERAAFVAALREELRALGNLPRFEVVLGGKSSIDVGGNIVDSIVAQGTNIHIGDTYIRQAGGRTGKDSRRALERYREQIVRDYGRLPLRGLDPRAGDPSSAAGVGLADVYIALDTTAQAEHDQARGKRRSRGAEMIQHRPLGALEATLRERRLVLLGEPGSGKSTFLNYVALCLAAHGLRPGEGWLGHLPGWPAALADALPVPVLARDFASWLPADEAATQTRVGLRRRPAGRQAPGRRGRAAGASARRRPRRGVRRRPRRSAYRQAARPGARRRGRVRAALPAKPLRRHLPHALVPGRSLAARGWPAFTLARFDREKIAGFIDAWYRELARLGRRSEAECQALGAALRAAVQRPGLAGLAPNPLLLTQMAIVHTHERLPDKRAQLYEKTIDLLLWNWEEDKARRAEAEPELRQLLVEAGAQSMNLLIALRELAFEAHRRSGQGDGVADIGEPQLEDALIGLHRDRDRNWVARVIAAMTLRAGLLLARGAHVYAFPHRTFQEYLAGSHLAAQNNFVQAAAGLLAEGAFWREAVLLAVGRLAWVVGEAERPLLLAGQLCPQPDVADEAGARRAWQAGEVLVEVGTQPLPGSELGQRLARDVPQALQHVVEGGFLTPVERAAAGDVLARLGDPRFRADAWHLPADVLLGFVEIPAGPFLMGSDKTRDRQADDDELPQHELTLPRYFIGRFPVTVAQFRAFIHDGGQVEDHDALRDPDTRPVSWVRWREALAYADWLTEKLREWPHTPEPLASLLRVGTNGKSWRVTLPSEAEWEKAARGADGRIYPWEGKLEPSRANYGEAGIHTTSAVGCFRRGASRYEIEDLSGNVWEWTRSVYKPYPYDATDGREDLSAPDEALRTVRGGAFHFDPSGVRAAVRLGSILALVNFGFRVVVSPFSPSEL